MSLKFNDLKKSVENHPSGLSEKEELAWRAMSYLNALYRFGKISADEVKKEIAEIEFFFMHSLSPYEKVMQEISEGGDALSIAYHLMKLQPEREQWKEPMKEILVKMDAYRWE